MHNHIVIIADTNRNSVVEASNSANGDYRIITETEYHTLLAESRINGILAGLELARKAWDKGLGREKVVEHEDYYKQELSKLRNT